jgi:hypothetical protein
MTTCARSSLPVRLKFFPCDGPALTCRGTISACARRQRERGDPRRCVRAHRGTAATSCRISTGAGSSASTKASHRRERGLRSFALARQGAASDTLPAGGRTSFLWTAERCASQGAHAPRGAVILAHQTGEAILWVSGLGVELVEAGTRGTADHQSRRRRRSRHRWV